MGSRDKGRTAILFFQLARPYTHDEPSTGQILHAGTHFGEQRGVAETLARHQMPVREAGKLCGKVAQGRPALQNHLRLLLR
jgi:hypothetical protein